MMKQGYFHQRRVWTERLTDLVPDLEIHIIQTQTCTRDIRNEKKFPEWMELPSWKELMLTVLILAAATGIGEIFSAWFYGCQYYYGISVWRHADIYSDQRLYL